MITILSTDWIWETVLPYAQPLADRYGFGSEWLTMCEERTERESLAAYLAARHALHPTPPLDIDAFRVVCNVSYAAEFAYRMLTDDDRAAENFHLIPGQVAMATARLPMVGKNVYSPPTLVAGYRKALRDLGLHAPDGIPTEEV